MPTEITAANIELHVRGIEEIWKEFNPEMTNDWAKIAIMRMSTRETYEKFVQAGDFRIPTIVGENQPIPDDNRQWPFPFTVQPYKVAMGWSVSDEAWEDDYYGEMDGSIEDLKLAFNKAREKGAADRINNATSTSATYVNPDGVALASASHKLQGGATTTNIMTSAFGPSSLETMRSNMLLQLSHRGDPDPADGPYDLLIHPSQISYAERVVYSTGQASTDANDKNVIGKNIRSIIASPYFTNSVFFALRYAKERLQPFGVLERRAARLTLEHDKRLEKMRYRISERYIFFEKGFRGLYYSAGTG